MHLLGGFKAIINWISQKLFGRTLFTTATNAGTTAGGLFGKALYTGMNGQVVTVGKLLGGLTLTAGGAAGAITTAVSAGSNWQDMSTGAKIGSQALQGVFSAATGLGALLLGASGPVAWAVALGTFATAAVIGMAQVQDGIGSVEEETKKLAEAQEAAKTANDNYLISLNNLSVSASNLEQVEQQTGLSGQALYEQVKNGTLTVDNMTSAQLRVYSAYLQNEEMIKQLKEATEQKTEVDKQAVLQSLRTEAANAIEADSYDSLKETVVNAWKEGSISAEEAGDILSRTLANADEETQRTFGENIPEDIRGAFNPDKYESTWRKFGDSIGHFFSDLWKGLTDGWERFWNWLGGKGWKTNAELSVEQGTASAGGRSISTQSYAIGTNYVPSDGLAYLHEGEAVIPKKYNQPYQPAGISQEERLYLQQMMSTMRSLDNTMKQGIPVNGQFVQRGSDLVAVINKTNSRTGADLLSNVAYAR